MPYVVSSHPREKYCGCGGSWVASGTPCQAVDQYVTTVLSGLARSPINVALENRGNCEPLVSGRSDCRSLDLRDEMLQSVPLTLAGPRPLQGTIVDENRCLPIYRL